MKRRQTGKRNRVSTAGEPFTAFVPFPLPPDPPLDLTPAHFDLLEQANRALAGAASAMGLTTPTVRTALDYLEQLQIVHKITGKRRDRLYVYDCYLQLLQAGAEPLGKE